MSEDFEICKGSWGQSTRRISSSVEGGRWPAASAAESGRPARSGDEPAGGSGNCITYQETHHQLSTAGDSSSLRNISPFGLSSSAPMADYWNQNFISTARSEENNGSSFQAMFDEDLNSKPLFQSELQISTSSVDQGFSSTSSFDKEIGRAGFPISGVRGEQQVGLMMNNYPYHDRAPRPPPLTIFHGGGGSGGSEHRRSTSWDPMFHPPPSPPSLPLERKPVTIIEIANSEAAGAAAGAKKGGGVGGEPAFKKPRMPSPLPTFKVRKEKLGDRITALQQMVSPFGKTDTASVLHEAIEYIKFLHDQVGVLSTPYLKGSGAGHPMHHHHQHHGSEKIAKDGGGGKQDLRSRGLCLVPIASTFAAAAATDVMTPAAGDFWTPAFGGTFA